MYAHMLVCGVALAFLITEALGRRASGESRTSAVLVRLAACLLVLAVLGAGFRYLRESRWNTITYLLTTGATSVRNLDLWPLVAYAVDRGYIQPSWYLISVESGFELWRGGTGLATDSFSVKVAGGGSP